MTRCLIIEDNTESRRETSRLLTDRGLEVQGLNHPVFQDTEDWEEHADLVLLDLSPPNLDRLDLVQRAIGQDAARPVIVYSSGADLEQVLGLMRAGAADYLPKPITEEALFSSLDVALGKLARQREMSRLSEVSRQRIEELSVLNRIAGLITSSGPCERWMTSVVQAACDHLGAQAGALLLLDAEGENLVFFADSVQAGASNREVRVPHGEGVAWACLQDGQPFKVDDALGNPGLPSSLRAHVESPIHSVLAVPIVIHGKGIGVIELVNKTGAPGFSDADLLRLTELASHLAVAVHNATSVRDLRQSRDELQRLSVELGQVVEERTQALRQLREVNRKVRQDMRRTSDDAMGARRALAEHERMAALGLLAAGVSHEINNPLGFVGNNIGVLRDYVRSLYRLAALVVHASKKLQSGNRDGVLRLAREALLVVRDENIPEVMNDIGPLFDETQHGLSRIEAIVEKLHRFSEGGLSNGDPILIDLKAEFQRLAELVQGSGASPLSIDFDDDARPVVRVPQMPLRLLLLNLLGHFTQRRSQSNRIRIRTGRAGQRALFEVLDPENELSSQELERLLVPESGGTENGRLAARGGLAVAAELASEIGGELKAVNLPTQGCSFRLLLPEAVSKNSMASTGGG